MEPWGIDPGLRKRISGKIFLLWNIGWSNSHILPFWTMVLQIFGFQTIESVKLFTKIAYLAILNLWTMGYYTFCKGTVSYWTSAEKAHIWQIILALKYRLNKFAYLPTLNHGFTNFWLLIYRVGQAIYINGIFSHFEPWLHKLFATEPWGIEPGLRRRISGKSFLFWTIGYSNLHILPFWTMGCHIFGF